jgi:hypothetical protein
MDVYLGFDVGSVTTKCAVITKVCELIAYNYLCIQGKPVPRDSGDSGKLRDNFLPVSASMVVRVWKYGPLESGLYFGSKGQSRSLRRLRLPFIMSRTYLLSCTWSGLQTINATVRSSISLMSRAMLASAGSFLAQRILWTEYEDF